MDWPTTPVEDIAPQRFLPGSCPWPRCSAHRPSPGRKFRFHRHGVFVRQCDRRVVPRFHCGECGRCFSLQSFAFSYYLKRPELSVPIAAGLHAGSAHRQLSRSLGCAPSTVTRRSARLGRHALLLSSVALQHLPRLSEPTVVDHFESFAFSQDHPLGLATVVGQRSWFVYDVDPAPHRRGGRTTEAQKRRLEDRWRSEGPPPRGAYVRSFWRVLDLLAQHQPASGRIILITDGHPAYRRALVDHPDRSRFEHLSFPNPRRGPRGSPRTPEARRRDRAMFPTDLLHGLLRHSCAHHRRETLAFGRRTNALLERGFLLAVWRNFVKRRSERRSSAVTPAMSLGLSGSPWSWTRVLAQRLFPSRLRVPRPWMKIYRRTWVTRALPSNTRHALTHAF